MTATQPAISVSLMNKLNKTLFSSIIKESEREK